MDFFQDPTLSPSSKILKAKDLAYLAFGLRIGIVYVDSLSSIWICGQLGGHSWVS